MISANEWDQRWETKDTPWDLRGVTPALVQWVKANPIKKRSILAPGCGSGHDAYFLGKHGGKVTAVDFSEMALAEARKRYPSARVDWQCIDVTAMPFESRFDRVWEYTCFCALNPTLRNAYFDNIRRALKPGGVYWGLVFSVVPDPDSGPPFQIEPEAFQRLLNGFFTLETFEPETPRSVKPRRGHEIWFSARK